MAGGRATPPTVIIAAQSDRPVAIKTSRNPSAKRTAILLRRPASAKGPGHLLHAIRKSIERGEAMKAITLLLLTLAALAVVGCSDNPAQPVSPTDKSAVVPGSLEKNAAREFTSTASARFDDPPFIVNPGFSKTLPDGKMILRGMLLKSRFDVTYPGDGPGSPPDLLSGDAVLEMNFTADPSTGEMTCWGKQTVTPDAPEALGGIWEFTWNGKGTFIPGVGWVSPLKQVGHGRGGVLTGMQVFGNLTTTVREFPVDWDGVGDGFIKSH